MSEYPWEDTEAPAEEAVPVTPVPIRLRDCLALLGPEQELDSNYPVGQFEIPIGEPPTASLNVAVVAVAEFDDKVVIAVPFNSWHRTIARRILPSGSLLKPLPLTVDLVDRSLTAGEEPRHFETAKIWVGLLAPSFEASVVFEEDAEISPDYQFSASDPALCPSVEGLAAAYQQHFAFVSAASSVEPSRVAAPGQTNPLEDRLKILEQSVQAIAVSLQQLTGTSGGTAAVLPPKTTSGCPPPGLAPQAAPQVVPVSSPPGLFTKARPGVVSGDSDIASSARLAGVPEHQIQEMLKLATKGKTRMGDLPQDKQPGQRGRNVLSETEDEDELIPDASGLGPGDPLAAAVTKLTEIAGHLTLEKKKSKTLEALLDGAGLGGTSESGVSSGSRKYSAALRALRNALTKQPEQVSRVLEKNMREDFYKVSQMPGSTAVPVSARAWLELRSRVQGFQTPIRFLWAAAGVLDALIDNRVAEARARCGLILAMGDQMAIDKGSWIIAGEIGLEEPPPMGAFYSHTLPTEAEPPHTRLIDPRWLELIMAQDFRCGQPAGEEETFGSSPHQSRVKSRCRSSSTTRCKRKGQRREGRERKSEGSCVRRSRSAARTAELMQDGASRAEAIGVGGSASTIGLSPDVELLEEGITADGGFGTEGNAAGKAPGAAASTVDVDTLWNSMPRWLLRSRSQQLRLFVHSSFTAG